ncbi:hypothetical protein P700755_002789 [Psychroflexus torquis ATCC 700755]|uniref:Uncharacterized protein n=1 Tax=Psychroflexus torquis (strain ATCC 700755 / CIP 106069 / ACAM 623) TaxID=313595 RepID=K4IVP5_PSYTT|nr:hypothetical protein P700755_002789 [Psychroflexus torquis ATCC 700755]
MSSLLSTNYIKRIEKNGIDPYELFAKGEEANNESFYV